VQKYIHSFAVTGHSADPAFLSRLLKQPRKIRQRRHRNLVPKCGTAAGRRERCHCVSVRRQYVAPDRLAAGWLAGSRRDRWPQPDGSTRKLARTSAPPAPGPFAFSLQDQKARSAGGSRAVTLAHAPSSRLAGGRAARKEMRPKLRKTIGSDSQFVGACACAVRCAATATATASGGQEHSVSHEPCLLL